MYEVAVFLLLHFEIKNYLIHFAVYTQTLKCTNWMRIFFFFFPLQIIAFCKIHILSIDCHSNQELTLFFPDLLFQGILYSVISRYPIFYDSYPLLVESHRTYFPASAVWYVHERTSRTFSVLQVKWLGWLKWLMTTTIFIAKSSEQKILQQQESFKLT